MGNELTDATADRIDALERRLRELLDKEEIRQTMYAYARGTDRCQPDLISDAYHDDAWDDHGNFRGGRDDVVKAIVGHGPAHTSSMHHVGNILIELIGEEANVETYFVACQLQHIGGRAFTRIRAGRYLDRFERRDGRWRIARRAVIDDWSRLDEVISVAPGVTARCQRGTSDESDPSYELTDFTRVFGPPAPSWPPNESAENR